MKLLATFSLSFAMEMVVNACGYPSAGCEPKGASEDNCQGEGVSPFEAY
jgi:hypothetical protein